MRILGLTSLKRDTAAALLEDGVVTAAIENDKLLRHPTRGVPDTAIQFCLDAAKITWNELDAIVVATRPIRGWLRRSVARATLPRVAPLAARFEADEIGRLVREISDLRTLKQLKQKNAACANVTTYVPGFGAVIFQKTLPFESGFKGFPFTGVPLESVRVLTTR